MVDLYIRDRPPSYLLTDAFPAYPEIEYNALHHGGLVLDRVIILLLAPTINIDGLLERIEEVLLCDAYTADYMKGKQHTLVLGYCPRYCRRTEHNNYSVCIIILHTTILNGETRVLEP